VEVRTVCRGCGKFRGTYEFDPLDVQAGFLTAIQPPEHGIWNGAASRYVGRKVITHAKPVGVPLPGWLTAAGDRIRVKCSCSPAPRFYTGGQFLQVVEAAPGSKVLL